MKFNIPKKFNLDKKLRKFQKNPELFFKDMLAKRTEQFKKHIPVKYHGNHKFTIVSAVYNVEKYLDDFFESITTQSLDFKEHIFIICIDDGSTDTSATIIKNWQKKYPWNIQYIYKENGGQASARNLGIRYTKTEWLTFIDPDDFINKDYFYHIDKALHSHTDLKMIVSNLHFFMETDQSYKDTHPLKYRFDKDNALTNIQDLKKNINLSAASTLFYRPIIDDNQITFDSRIKPNFEDGKFIADYLMNCNNGQALFLKSSLYYYRKRADGDSTLDTSWQLETKYDDVIRFGFIPMLEEYKKEHGYIPSHIQRTALYDMSWYVQYLLDNDEKLNFLSSNQKLEFLTLIKKVFTYIDENTILEFNLARIWFFQKVGMLGLFKGKNPEQQIAYIENIDLHKKQILISHFTFYINNLSYNLNGIDIIPEYEKYIEHTFASEHFVYEKKAWIPFSHANQQLTFYINKKQVRLTLKGKQYTHLKISQIIDEFKSSKKYKSNSDEWLLMDRDIQADDNAEHLYRFIQNNYPEQKICFALKQDCPDWQRLQNDKFNLVEFGSLDFENKLKSTKKIISSQLDHYIYNYFNDEYELSKQFIFLQHGVIKDDLSNWTNSKRAINLFVTSTEPEYRSIINDFNYYNLTSKEVILTGLPRHDALLQGNIKDNKLIMIMPTWRKNIVGTSVGVGTERHLNEEFIHSDYAIYWKNLLHSPKLKTLLNKYNYSVVFVPHLNVEPYLSLFEIPDYISIWKASEEKTSIQRLFQQANILITDYSSVAFEMGYLHKTVLYYQFDQDEVFSGTHTYKKGYFDYDLDGFGPVSTNEPDLLKSLNIILQNNAIPCEPYLTRMTTTFPFKDGKNCERVYQAIINLDITEENTCNISILKKYIQFSAWEENWLLLKERSLSLIQYGHTDDLIYAQKQLSKALANLNDTKEWYRLIPSGSHFTTIHSKYYSGQWSELHTLLEDSIEQLDVEEKMYYLECCAQLKSYSKETEKILSSLTSDDNVSEITKTMANVWYNLAHENWKNTRALLKEASFDFSSLEWKQYRPYLLLAKVSHYVSPEEVDSWLDKYAEEHGKDAYFYLELINMKNYH